MIVISGVPGKEINKDEDGKILEGKDRTPGHLGPDPAELGDVAAQEGAQRHGRLQRALCQGNCAPNHYWNRSTNKPDLPALFEQMEREVKTYGIDSWKWYCHTDPGRSGNGFKLDDEKLTLPVLREVEGAGDEDLQRAQGLCRRSRGRWATWPTRPTSRRRRSTIPT